MWRTLLELQNLPHARAFRVPVSRDDVPDYYEFIKNPMGGRSQTLTTRMALIGFYDRFHDHGA